jgi:sigma-B regulation protein RsbU (phosphoserine phosphatase)
MARSHSLRARYFALLCLVLGMTAAPALARVDPPHPPVDPHHVVGTSVGVPVDLSSSWLLQQGDDPRFADPRLDDSHWTLVQGGRALNSYGLKNVDLVWYRDHVQVTPGAHDLSLLMRGFAGSYVLYVNGVEVGSSGTFPKGGSVFKSPNRRFAIPDSLLQSGNLVIAIRASTGILSVHGTTPAGFDGDATLLLGPSDVLAGISSLIHFRRFTPWSIDVGLELLVLLIALGLAFTLRSDREYQALVLYLTADVLLRVLDLWQKLGSGEHLELLALLSTVLFVCRMLALVEFVRLALDLRRSKPFVIYEWTLLSALVGFMTLFLVWEHISPGAHQVSGPSGIILLVVIGALVLPVDAGIPLLSLWVWHKRRNSDALLLSIPLFLQSAILYYGLLKSSSLEVPHFQSFYLQWKEIADLLFIFTLLVFLLRRTLRIARSRAAMASELHAAQSIQNLLLARASHPTPGFRVESVYHPAGEVGGDFFLVSPGPDGSLTAIVGDVSGKGLVAALRVSMILGVLRREQHRSPAEILQGLNEALLLHGDSGFTTACCVRLERCGNYTIANAGHLSPYVAGVEIETAPSLPLGIAESADYAEVSGELAAGVKMVLLSDGVVEARSAKGELYGFERLAHLTTMTAHDIADVAQRFGQEDDITVLTIALTA